MGALPKRKISSTRRDKRRTHHSVTKSHLIPCSNCGEFKPAHQLCPSCRTYGGRQILPQIEE